MSRAILQVMIRGRVQGVGYRAWLEHQATTCGLEGWVRNRRDGSVEALVQGSEPAIAAIIDWARRGPPGAQVASLIVSEAVPETSTSFEQRPTL
jgi:acylphosphatase